MNHTFYIQADCLEAIKTLPAEKRNAMLGAIAGYQIDESMPDFENEMQVIFLIAKVFIDQRKRRSLSHTRGKATAPKPRTRTKSARESFKEILENSVDENDVVEKKPAANNQKEKAPEPAAQQPSLPSDRKSKTEKANKAQRPRNERPSEKDITVNANSQSPEIQLAIKKLTALCNKSRQRRK